VATFPALYRAKAVDTTGRKVTAFVPAVFGEESVTIVDSVGALPADPGMGWVFFQAGNPEFPVWVGAQQGEGGGGGGGTGADEVWIGPNAPTDPAMELWYDTDATGIGLAVLSYTHNQGTPASLWTIIHNLGWYPNAWVRDSGGTNVEGDVTQVDTNTMTIAFSASFAGVAYHS
jgi:hypothetical protein